nr:hypothetical protein [Tanacetum cinerariifolium]
MSKSPELVNESYILYDHVINPFTTQQERKTRKDYGTRRGHHSTYSSSTFDQPSSSHLNNNDDDGNDKGASQVSTPSPTRFVISLTNKVPRVFKNPPNIDPNMEPFYSHQTKIINRQVQLRDEHRGGLRDSTQASSFNPFKKIKLTIILPRQLFVNISSNEDVTTAPSQITTSFSPSLPNTSSKTPSTKDTSSTFGTTSSLFKSKPQSLPPTSNDTPSSQPSNPFFENVMDAPPRHSHLYPLLLQRHPSLDINLFLSLVTPLDHILDTPSSPSPKHNLNHFSWVTPFTSTIMIIMDVALPPRDQRNQYLRFEDYSILMISRILRRVWVKENQEKDKNRIKTGQKQEACRSQEKFEAAAVERGRKTKENKKRMAKNAYTYQKLFNFKEKKKKEGPEMKFFQSINH